MGLTVGQDLRVTTTCVLFPKHLGFIFRRLNMRVVNSTGERNSIRQCISRGAVV